MTFLFRRHRLSWFPALGLLGGLPPLTEATATPLPETGLHLRWEDNADNETGFVIERATDGEEFQVLAEVAADSTTFTDDAAVSSVPYRYRVRAFNPLGFSTYSNIAENAAFPSTANTPPSISAIPDCAIAAGSGTPLIEFIVADRETDASVLLVTAHSSNPDLAASADIFLWGRGSERVIVVRAGSALVGAASITVTVNDGELSSSIAFTLQTHATGELDANGGASPPGIPLAAVPAGRFTVDFDVCTPITAGEVVIGLSPGPVGHPAGLAAAVRFRTDGWIDALDGTSYHAPVAMPHAPGLAWRIRLVIDPGTQTYAVYVTPTRGSTLTLGHDFRFGPAAEPGRSLDTWSSWIDEIPTAPFALVASVQTAAGGSVPRESDGLQFNDVGAPALPGAQYVREDVSHLRSGLSNVDPRFDHFRFGHQPVESQAELTVKVERVGPFDGSSIAGLMIRGSLAPLAAYAGVFVTPDASVVLRWREVDGGDVHESAPLPRAGPQWLRLTRIDDLFQAICSDDGENWHLVHHVSSRLPAVARGGIAVGALDSARVSSATFSTFTHRPTLPAATGGTAPVAAAGIVFHDLGAPELPGASVTSENWFVIRSGVADRQHDGDHFRFGAVAVRGDGELSVHVNRFVLAGRGALAGLMFRDSLEPHAASVGVFVTPEQGVVLRWRETAGAAVQVSAAYPASAPQWLRLIRAGDFFYALGSDDGATWDLIEFACITLPDTLQGGLAVGSEDTAEVASATFSAFALE